MPFSFLCIATYFKGNEFLKSCKEAGNTVYLLTEKKLEHKPWLRSHIDELFFVETPDQGVLDLNETAKGLAYVLRSRKIDRIVALDDFDVEKGAFFRETFRLPGMGQTVARYFRDKLAMRMKAAEAGLRVPTFSALFNDAEVNAFADSVTFPVVVKPRGEASTAGIRKVWNKDELWQVIHSLGDRRHEFLVEQFKPGHVYHVDALTYQGKVLFNWVSQYLSTPMEVAHGGGVFRSVTTPFGSAEERALRTFNEKLLTAFGLEYSASHSEFIQCHEDGEFYFLETASRVGGAHLAEMVEAASGINLWREWARIETATVEGTPYELPELKPAYSGIIISLAREQWPDLSEYVAPEIGWRMQEEYHVGLIVQSENRDRILELLDQYTTKIYAEVHASAPVRDTPSH
ncbi:ATPase [Siphonobacter sp. BAB-5405]|uniref:ATP-grasp domain-containing protein n=1 Tax=Siphonobacter sp. BAB-5405 TaxID=1864825 RepID=UPI000C809478|nr:ATPase [Siphonobacter sp. BAB-5405]PMD99435.1 ATPase [Siphonobacter sp. BAB-5405]